MTQEELLEQMYGILDDWKAQRFGGEPIVEAIEKLAAVSGGGRRDEVEALTGGMRELADALVQQQVIAATELTSALKALAAISSDDTDDDGDDDEAKASIRHNVAELALRMGPKLGTGDEPLTIGDPVVAQLSDVDPILPVPLLPGGQATVYGAGLGVVTGVVVDGCDAVLGRVLPGEVDFTVPSDAGPGDVLVTVFLPENKAFAFEVEVGGGQTTVEQSQEGVQS